MCRIAQQVQLGILDCLIAFSCSLLASTQFAIAGGQEGNRNTGYLPCYFSRGVLYSRHPGHSKIRHKKTA